MLLALALLTLQQQWSVYNIYDMKYTALYICSTANTPKLIPTIPKTLHPPEWGWRRNARALKNKNHTHETVIILIKSEHIFAHDLKLLYCYRLKFWILPNIIISLSQKVYLRVLHDIGVHK